MMTSATKEVLPIVRLDDQPVGHPQHRGHPGPVYKKIRQAYDALIDELRLARS
jgi:D-alanine transaminase